MSTYLHNKEIEEIKKRLESGAYNDEEVLLFNRRIDKLQRHLGNEPRQSRDKEADDAVRDLLSQPIPRNRDITDGDDNNRDNADNKDGDVQTR